MGVTAEFTLVSRAHYARLLADPAVASESEARVQFWVGKSWVFFKEVFESFGEPLNKVFTGDYLPEGIWGSCGGEGHFGYISPELASAISQALIGVEPEQIFARATELGLVLVSEHALFYREYYFEIKIGFRVAVRCGGGLLIGIG